MPDDLTTLVASRTGVLLPMDHLAHDNAIARARRDALLRTHEQKVDLLLGFDKRLLPEPERFVVHELHERDDETPGVRLGDDDPLEQDARDAFGDGRSNLLRVGVRDGRREEEEEERVEFREEEVIESLQYRRLCSVKRLFNGRKEYRLTLW